MFCVRLAVLSSAACSCLCLSAAGGEGGSDVMMAGGKEHALTLPSESPAFSLEICGRTNALGKGKVPAVIESHGKLKNKKNIPAVPWWEVGQGDFTN